MFKMSATTALFFTIVWLTFNKFQCFGDSERHSKRILLTDQSYVDHQQMQKDLLVMKATIEQLKQRLYQQETGMQKQDQINKAQARTITELQSKIAVKTGAVYIQWGRKTCTGNGTELVYSGIGGGGLYNEPGRSALPVCVPHDPDLGPVIGTAYFATIYGMEYNEKSFGADLYDKDVPCAVCLASHATSTLLIPGRKHCYNGWKLEYQGLLASGYHGDAGASSYICVDKSPDVLEGGIANENGYNLFPVKAVCGSLRCPPYVPNGIFNCVVCSK